MAQKPAWQEEIARERIDLLFQEAERTAGEHPERADRYVEIARRIAMKFNLSLPRKHRERFCSSCYTYLMPGRNARVRIDAGTKKITCADCGDTMRFPYD